jgi:hypothetical protein
LMQTEWIQIGLIQTEWMQTKWTQNNAPLCPVRDNMLVESETPPILRRAVGTQQISHLVPNGTKGVWWGGFYQHHVPTGQIAYMVEFSTKYRTE